MTRNAAMTATIMDIRRRRPYELNAMWWRTSPSTAYRVS